MKLENNEQNGRAVSEEVMSDWVINDWTTG